MRDLNYCTRIKCLIPAMHNRFCLISAHTYLMHRTYIHASVRADLIIPMGAVLHATARRKTAFALYFKRILAACTMQSLLWINLSSNDTVYSKAPTFRAFASHVTFCDANLKAYL